METLEINNYENYSGAYDAPDSRDYTSEEVFGAAEAYDFPEQFSLEKVKNEQQGYIGACSVFGTLNAYNEKFANASDKPYTNQFDFWKAWDLCKTRGATDSGWFSIQGAMQACKDLGYIGAYILMYAAGSATVSWMKAAIYGRKSGITTGSATINWAETLRTEELNTNGVKYGVGAHCFDITEWDDDFVNIDGSRGCFVSYNSFSLPSGGKFRIPYNKIHLLFSTYEFTLTDDQIATVKKKRENIYLDKAAEAKIWDESRATDLATGREISIMVNRALWLPDDFQWFRSAVNLLMNDKICRDKIILTYNEKNKWQFATDEEFGVMFTRAATRNPLLEEVVLSRKQVAEIVGRDFL